MGHLREQSPRQVLPPNARGRAAPSTGNGGVEPARRRHRSRAQRSAGERMISPVTWWRLVRASFDRRAIDRDMDEEMALHIDLHAEALERAGLSREEARRRAVAEFGGVQ